MVSKLESGRNNRITMQDILNAGVCRSGSKTFFERKGINFNDFLRDGIDIELLRSFNSPHANKVIRHKEAQNGSEET